MKKLELAYEIIKESKKSRALYLESGRDYHKVAAHMYSIFECYAHGLIKWDTVRTYWHSSILEYLDLYKDNKKLYVTENHRMLTEYENTLKRFKPALDEYKKVSEAKMTSNIVVKKQISESVAKDHSNIYFNKRSLSESAIKDIAHTSEWKKVVESYPNLTASDKDRLRMLTIFENDTFNVTGWSKLNEGPTLDTTQLITTVMNEGPTPKMNPADIEAAMSSNPSGMGNQRPSMIGSMVGGQIGRMAGRATGIPGAGMIGKAIGSQIGSQIGANVAMNRANAGKPSVPAPTLSTSNLALTTSPRPKPRPVATEDISSNLTKKIQKGIGQLPVPTLNLPDWLDPMSVVPKNIVPSDPGIDHGFEITPDRPIWSGDPEFIYKPQHPGFSYNDPGFEITPTRRNPIRGVDLKKFAKEDAPKTSIRPVARPGRDLPGGGYQWPNGAIEPGPGFNPLSTDTGMTSSPRPKPRPAGLGGADASSSLAPKTSMRPKPRPSTSSNVGRSEMSPNPGVWDGSTRGFESVQQEGYKTIKSIDKERYDEIPGLEGPFMTLSGKVVYYDPKEGSYYDRDTDMYLSYEEFKELDNDYSGMKNTRNMKEAKAKPGHNARAMARAQDIIRKGIEQSQKNVDKKNDEKEKVDESTHWEVSYDYGPHQSNTLSVKAKSKEEALDKAKQVAKDVHNHNRITSISISPKKNESLDESKSYVGRETKDGTWKVFKTGNAVAVAGPFKSAQEAKAWIKTQSMQEQVDEAGAFSYGKKPRKGTVAYNAAEQRKKQEKDEKPIEPKDQKVGNAKVTKDKVDEAGSYRDRGAQNMMKADQKAEREVAKMRAQAAKRAENEAAKKKEKVDEAISFKLKVTNPATGNSETQEFNSETALKDYAARAKQRGLKVSRINEANTSYEKDMDHDKAVVISGVKGVKSTPFRKKFKNMAAYDKWSDSEEASNYEVHEVMNESVLSESDIINFSSFAGMYSDGAHAYFTGKDGKVHKVSATGDRPRKFYINGQETPWDEVKRVVGNQHIQPQQGMMHESINEGYSDRVQQIADRVNKSYPDGVTRNEVNKLITQFAYDQVEMRGSEKAKRDFIKDVASKINTKRDTSKSDAANSNKEKILSYLATAIETAVGNSMPDGDPWDAISVKGRKAGIDPDNLLKYLDLAARKHLGSKGYYDYLRMMWDAYGAGDFGNEPEANWKNPWKAESIGEAVTLDYSRHMRSHGKKPRDPGYSSLWMFTTREYGMPDDDEIFKFQGSFADAKKAAAQWAKSQGAYRFYVME